jgi:hypothetical protein
MSDARYGTLSTAQDALTLQNSLSDFRAFLRYGCADSRGNSGGSRLTGNFTICGSDSIESANHRMRRSMVLASVPKSDLKLFTGADAYDIRSAKYRSRSDWMLTALLRRERFGSGIHMPASSEFGGQIENHIQLSALMAGETEGSAFVDELGFSGPRYIGAAAEEGEAAGSNVHASVVHTATGGTVTEYTDGTATFGAGDTTGDGRGMEAAQAYSTAAGSVEASDGTIVANGDVSANGLSSEEDIIVSDQLVVEGEQVALADDDGVPSPSDSFFVQVDTEDTNGEASALSDVPLPAGLPLLAGALALLAGLRGRMSARS